MQQKEKEEWPFVGWALAALPIVLSERRARARGASTSSQNITLVNFRRESDATESQEASRLIYYPELLDVIALNKSLGRHVIQEPVAPEEHRGIFLEPKDKGTQAALMYLATSWKLQNTRNEIARGSYTQEKASKQRDAAQFFRAVVTYEGGHRLFLIFVVAPTRGGTAL